jgi:hypothetical protein
MTVYRSGALRFPACGDFHSNQQRHRGLIAFSVRSISRDASLARSRPCAAEAVATPIHAGIELVGPADRPSSFIGAKQKELRPVMIQ